MKPNDQRPAAATAPRDAASDIWSKRGETIEDKISQLDAEVIRYKEQIKKTRPGPAQEVVKARMKRKIRQKRVYERQRDILHNRNFGANQVSLAEEKIKASKQKKKRHNSGQSNLSFLSILFPRCCILS
uniref:Uncharacterized protein n=1 Tax=Kalanchoe fedtschenkoi TaxID=63787 RepID=A0A7N0TM51_KALFE